MEEITAQVGAYTPIIINVVKAIIFLVLGLFVSSLVANFIRSRIVNHPRIDDTLGNFAASVVKWLILAFVGIAVLQLFGFQVTSLIAVLGAASLAIGLALQGTLSDLASGVMLIIFRPYKLGDFVDIAGTTGTVKSIDLFVTELSAPDNIRIVMPNSKAWGSIIINYTNTTTRRAELVFGIDYANDPDDAMNVILDVVNADERTLSDPTPWVGVTNLGDSSVDITLRVWCKPSDWWQLKCDLMKNVKYAFDANGIDIPYPHTQIVSVSKDAREG